VSTHHTGIWDMTAEVLPVGDGQRSVLGRSVVAVLVVSVVFYAYVWLAKEVPFLYAQTPWRDDPYDAVISFMFVAVPLLICLSAVRLVLCRRFEPLPVRRALNLVQICWLLCLAMAVTLASEWVSLGLGGHPLTGTAVSTGLIAVLGLMSMAVLVVTIQLRRTRRLRWATGKAPSQPDWLADAVTLAQREASRLGRPGGVMVRVVQSLDRSLITFVRRRPLLATGAFGVALSLVTDGPHIVLEAYRPTLAIWFVAVSSCSVFAFLVIAARYLHLIERPQHRVSPVVYAVVLATLCVPVVASFRGSLWWIVGATDSTAGLPQLVELTTVLPAVVGVVTYIVRRLIDRQRSCGSLR
jgi:hypothetical protein